MGIVALCPMAIVALGLRPWATIAIGHRATIPIVALGGYEHGHIVPKLEVSIEMCWHAHRWNGRRGFRALNRWKLLFIMSCHVLSLVVMYFHDMSWHIQFCPMILLGIKCNYLIVTHDCKKLCILRKKNVMILFWNPRTLNPSF